MNDRPHFYEAPDLMDEHGAPIVFDDVYADLLSVAVEESVDDASRLICGLEAVRPVDNEIHSVADEGTESEGRHALDVLLYEYEHIRNAMKRCVRASHEVLRNLQQKRHRIEQQERTVRRRTELASSSTSFPIFKLNVGGMRFHVQRETFLQFDVTLFHVLCNEQFAVQKDECGYVFFDRDPWLFRELLFLLRERRQCLVENEVASPLVPPQDQQGDMQHHRHQRRPQELYSVGQRRLAELPPIERQRLLEEARYYGLNELVAELLTRQYEWRHCVFGPLPSLDLAHGCDQVQPPLLASLREFESQRLEEGGHTPLPPPRCCFASSVFLNGSMYLFGGFGSEGEVIGTLYRFQLKPGSMCEAGAEIEGNDSGNCREPHGANSDAKGRHTRANACVPGRPFVWYDLVEPHREGRRGVPPPRTGHAAASWGNCFVLVFYGNNLYHHLRDVWMYHTIQNAWYEVKVCGADVPARSGHTVTVMQGRFYLFGGKDLFQRDARCFADVYEGLFDAEGMELTWRLASSSGEVQQTDRLRRPLAACDENCGEPCDAPSAAYHSAVEYKGRYIIVYGGLRDSEGITNGGNPGGLRGNMGVGTAPAAYDTNLRLYVFDTLGGTWQRVQTRCAESKDQMGSDIPLTGHVAVLCHDDMYVMGSYDCTHHQRLEVFRLSLVTLLWCRVPTSVAVGHIPPCSRALPSIVLLPPTVEAPRSVIMVFGGYNTNTCQYLNDSYLISL